MDREAPSVYFAGPLFSAAERAFNERLCARVEAAGSRVFLPQRDGVEGDRPPYDAMPREERRRAMFARDVSEIEACDVFLIVLDGRVPDEGACFELGLAYGEKRRRRPGKRLLGLQTDARAAFPGAKLNPMLAVALDEVAADGEERPTSRRRSGAGRGRDDGAGEPRPAARSATNPWYSPSQEPEGARGTTPARPPSTSRRERSTST